MVLCLLCDFVLYAIGAILTVAILYNVLSFDRSKINPGGKYVLITGCDSGFGLATAQSLSRLGINVIATVLDPNGDGAKQLSSIGVKCIQCDVTKDEDAQRCLAETKTIIREHGLWALINNAGVCLMTEIEVTPPQIAQAMVNVNFGGVVRMTQTFLKLVRKARGRVVIVSSMSAHFPAPLMGIYAGTKAGVSSFSFNLREEMKKFGVKVTTVEPLAFNTELVKRQKSLLENNLDKIDPEVRNDYTPKYFERQMRILNHISNSKDQWLLNNSLDDVIEAITRGVVDANPPAIIKVGFGATLFHYYCVLTPTLLISYLGTALTPLKKIIWTKIK